MSDPMKQMEIEDVLSSIRRLVADEVAERAVPEALNEDAASDTDAAPATDPSDEAPTDKLVLTAALRVPEPAEEDVSELVEADNQDAEDVSEDTSDPEEDMAEMPAEDAPEAEDEALDTAEDTSEEELAAEETDNADAWEEISLEDRIAELEAAVADRDEEWEPDGSEEAQAEEIQFTSLRAAFSEVEEPQPEVADPEPADTPEEPELAQEAPAPEAAATDETDTSEDASNMFEDEADVLDEEMLRQLVTDIVREELQGTLGERITRNVRKLVRREINTLLATRDFD